MRIARARKRLHGNRFFFGLFLLFWFVPGASDAFWTVVYLITNALGIPSGLAEAGWREFWFWKR